MLDYPSYQAWFQLWPAISRLGSSTSHTFFNIAHRHEPLLPTQAQWVPTPFTAGLSSCGKSTQAHKVKKLTSPLSICSVVESSTRSYFSNEVDGLSSNDGILVVGPTNNLDQLDPSITKRPGRFDRRYHFSLPSEDEQLAYCCYWRQKFIDSDEVDFPEEICHAVAKLTDKVHFCVSQGSLHQLSAFTCRKRHG